MKQPKPFFRKQTKTYYVQIGGKQIPLGADRPAAWQKYSSIMAGRQVAELTTTFATLALQFLAWCKKHRAAETHGFYKRHCLSFVKHTGDLKISEMKKFHVTEWLDAEYAGGGSNHQRNAARSIQRCLNWAVEEGKMEYNPLAKMKKPSYVSREDCITVEQWKNILTDLTSNKRKGATALLEVLTLMQQTGCRPQEARTVEARHFDEADRCLVLERKLSKGKRDQRVIPLTDTAFALCQKNAKLHPEGPIFCNAQGNPWTTNSLKKRMRELSEKLGFRVFCYSLRHLWATEAITNGVDLVTVATIMGHSDLTQLMKTYQHVKKRGSHLRAAMHQAVGATPTQASQA